MQGEVKLRIHPNGVEHHCQPPAYLNICDHKTKSQYFITETSGGLVSGDCLTVDVVVDQPEKRHFILPVAANLLKSNVNEPQKQIELNNNFSIRKNNFAVFHNQPAIPCKGVNAVQKVCIHTEPDASFIYIDSWSNGRYYHGESWAFETLVTQLSLYNDNQIVCQENSEYQKDNIAIFPIGIKPYNQWWSIIYQGDQALPIIENMITFFERHDVLFTHSKIDDYHFMIKALSIECLTLPLSVYETL